MTGLRAACRNESGLHDGVYIMADAVRDRIRTFEPDYMSDVGAAIADDEEDDMM